MCGIAGYSLSCAQRVDRTLAAQSLLAGIAERGADAVGYAYRGPGDAYPVVDEAAHAGERAARPDRRARRRPPSCSSTSATTRRAIRRSRPTTTPSATGRSSASTTGSSSTTTSCSSRISCARSRAADDRRLRGDLRARRALAATTRARSRSCTARMAAAWLDARVAGHDLRRPRRRPAALDRRAASTSSSSPRPAPRSRSSSSTSRVKLRKREIGDGHVPRAARRARSRVEERFRPDHELPRPDRRCRPCARRRRASPASSALAVLAAASSALLLPAAGRPSPTRDALLVEPLAHEELERRPRAAARVEHPVDLPLGQQRRRPSLRASAQSANFGSRPSARASCDALLDGALEPLLPHRHVEAGLAQRVRERAERVPVERLRRQPALVLVDVARGRRPAELLAELAAGAPSSSSRVAKRRGTSPAPRFAAFHEPKCSITVCGCTVVSGSAANSRIVGERPSRSAHASSSRDDLLVRVALADPGLELRELAGIDRSHRPEAGLLGHDKNGRAGWAKRKCARARRC